MQKRTSLAVVVSTALLVTGVAVGVQPAQAATGLHISGRNVVEANGSTFIMRGAAHGYAWYLNQNGSFADMKSLGANTVRVVLTGSTSATQAQAAINLCKTNKEICMLEVHDTTGYPDGGAKSLDWAANYWIAMKSVLVGQENYVAIDIGNEPWGNNNPAGWTNDMQNAIIKLRNNGFEHLLVADAPNWGQDNQGVMKSNAAALESADPQHNTLFSVHMYGVYGQASTITSYLNAFSSAGLPLIIGEFGGNSLYGDVDEDTIINTAQSLGDGWLAWSWSGNDSAESFLDLAISFNKNNLSAFGQRVFNGANGISSTSKQATIYN